MLSDVKFQDGWNIVNRFADSTWPSTNGDEDDPPREHCKKERKEGALPKPNHFLLFEAKEVAHGRYGACCRTLFAV